MQGADQIEAYRRMTPAERLRIAIQLMAFAWRSLLELPDEERHRRLALARREHDLSNKAIEAALR